MRVVLRGTMKSKVMGTGVELRWLSQAAVGECWRDSLVGG